MPGYDFNKQLAASFEEAIAKVTAELKKEGFGILTEIDVKETLKKKLNVEFPEYKILGACNPPFAHKALTVETNIGALLPCNVVVYEKDGGIFLSVMRPSVAMGMIDNPELGKIAGEVEIKLKRVFDSIH